MQRVIVTVKRDDEARVRDLEVPAEIDSARLTRLIAEALRWDGDASGVPQAYDIEAHPLGRTLQPEESLSSAGVWDGAWLVFHPVSRSEMPAQGDILPQVEDIPSEDIGQPTVVSVAPEAYREELQAPAPAISDEVAMPSSPTVTGWRSLGLDLPVPAQNVDEAAPRAEERASSFVWKQLDD
jgi:hypothetical protein